ncbi:MAG: 3-methyl-2-oxobutanoate dehydrogenase subunit VorB [Bacillota bacterium]
MAEKVLVKGNEAIAEAAIRAGCRFFFGYPITPQNEITEYMARRMPEVGGVFLQAESEIAAINMVYGVAAAGARVMTSSSGPGISLKQEGISYLAGAELPCVIVNMMRGGPGLGGIQPAQSDYFQATKGGGHGDYRLVVYGPASIQEAVDLMAYAFDVAEKYRNPVMLLGDGMLGQMMEPVEFPEFRQLGSSSKPWVTDGAKGRPPRVITSLYLNPEELDAHCWAIQRKYAEIRRNEVRVQVEMMDEAEYCLVAYGTMARICRSALERCRQEGIKVGLIRPITLWPFPSATLREYAASLKAVVTVEMSAGQMVEDVMLAVNGQAPVHFYGRTGGAVPTPKEIVAKLQMVAKHPEEGRLN